MQRGEGAGTDAAWTQWKTLHHQTRDLSPWMTEAVSLGHMQTSLKRENLTQVSQSTQTERSSKEAHFYKRYWKRIVFAGAFVVCVLICAVVPAAVISSRSRNDKSAPPTPSETQTPPPPLRVQGIATFNDYSAQKTTVCSGTQRPTNADNVHRFMAAAGDISKDISSGQCDGSSTDMNHQYDTSICTAQGGQFPPSTYNGPSCPPAAVKCGTCYRVDNLGPWGSTSSDTIIGSIVVEIVDACPAGNAYNYCKTGIPLEERCGSNVTNSLDIDVSAYGKLMNRDGGGSGGPNLRINITLDVPCDSIIN